MHTWSTSLRSYFEKTPAVKVYKPAVISAAVQALKYIEQEDATKYKVKEGFVPNMRVPGYFYVNNRLKELIFEELQHSCQRGGHGGFLPAVQQLANVAGLPGIVKVCFSLQNRLSVPVCRYKKFVVCAEIDCSSRRSFRLWICHWQCCSFRYGRPRIRCIARRCWVW